MKKYLPILFLLILIMPALAQNQFDHGYTVQTVYVIRVAQHANGYLVRYVKTSDGQPATTFIPHSWFRTVDADGNPRANQNEQSQLFWGRGDTFPRLSVLSRDGQVVSVRLYLSSNLNDFTWATFNNNSAFAAEFSRMEENPTFEF
ncbi:MAG: hypothetical protein FWE37_01570 [Spirochaetaceae bacterium]|nr:hypothetical protein [Spirochaetaceae bacterium]